MPPSIRCSTNYYDNFVTVVVGWAKKKEKEVFKKYENFENKYADRKDRNGELKSTTLKQKKFECGFASLDKANTQFIMDFLSIFDESTKLYFSVASKIEYLVFQLFIGYQNNFVINADAVKYSITKALVVYSAAETAALYGEYTFGMTLFALPPSFIYPLSVSLMPAVSAALTRGDRTAAGKAAGAAMKLTVLTALPAGVGLSVLAEPILLLLYPAVPDTARAAAYHLTFLGLACVFVCLMVAANGVLQAYGHPLVPVLALLCGGVLKVVTNYLMVGDPATGIRGAAVSTLYCYALIVLIDLIAIARLVPERPGYIRLFARPVLVTAVMALAARSGYGLFCRVLPERWAVLPAIAVAAAVYVILALAVGAVTRTDVVTLPKGEKIADFLHLR